MKAIAFAHLNSILDSASAIKAGTDTAHESCRLYLLKTFAKEGG